MTPRRRMRNLWCYRRSCCRSKCRLKASGGSRVAIRSRKSCSKNSRRRALEVLEINGEEQSFLGWYNIHVNSGQFDPEMPLLQRRLTPEWAHNKTQKRAKPKEGEEHNYTKIFGEFGVSEIEIVVPQFHVQSGGKIPEPVCRKVDAWLRLAARRSPRAVLALSYPTAPETTKQAAFRRRGVR